MSRLPALERLVSTLKKLPGIGEKSATRLAFFVLASPDAFAEELASAIQRVKRDITVCERCFDLCEQTPCPVCADPRRDASVLCVVEDPADRAAIERSGGFDGLYHVLGGALSPIEGIGPDDLRLAELEKRVQAGEVAEIILATNPNAEGDATAFLVADRLRASGVRMTRIAYGMPLGGDLEYADHVTVGRSLQNRREID